MRWTTPLRPEMKFVPAISDSVERSTPSGNLTISYFKNEIPPFVKAEMERLYQNSFSSVAAEHVDSSNTSCYVVSSSGVPVTIFLVRYEKGQARVLNAAIKINAEEIRRFANYIFAEHKSVTTISFQSVRIERIALTFPSQHFNASEDIVLALPDSVQTYLGSLGKSTRKYIKYHLNRPIRHFPSYSFRIYENDEINEQLIQDIIDLNTARMDEKNKVSTIDDTHRNWILKIAKAYGFVGAATINGRICAGVICSRVGANYFMHVIAHDPSYNEFRLGMLNCYMTICAAIERDGKEFHFLWGQGDYKYRLLGVQHDLDNLMIYRSRTQYFLNFDLVMKNVVSRYARDSKVRIEKNSGNGTFSARLVVKIIDALHMAQRVRHIAASGIRKLVPLKSHDK